MKKKRFLSLILCICLVSLFVSQAVFATVPPAAMLSDEQIFGAVQGLINAEAEFYNIRKIRVQRLEQTQNENGTVDVTCNIVFYMCLKAQSVEELPYVAGMLNRLGVANAAECRKMSQDSSIVATKGIFSVDAVVATQATKFLNGVAENIGQETELAFSVTLNVNADGTINSVLGMGDNGTFPLSDYYPDTREEMYQSGANYARGMIQAETYILSTNETMAASVPVYYRLDARDYANAYTSNATVHYDGGKTWQNPSKYNKAYNFYKDADCANFVSQAILYGGIPRDSIWYPYVYAWINVGGLEDYFYTTKKYVTRVDFSSCPAGGFIVSGNLEKGRTHVVMCVLNDTVNHAYSAHTNDRLKYAFSSSYPGSGYYAHYYFFPVYSNGTIHFETPLPN